MPDETPDTEKKPYVHIPGRRVRKFPDTYVNRQVYAINPTAIVFCRLALNWTQDELASYIGVSSRSITNWEGNKAWPTEVLAQRLALWIETTKRQLKHRQLRPGPRFYAMFPEAMGLRDDLEALLNSDPEIELTGSTNPENHQ